MSTDITYSVLRKENMDEKINVFIKTLWFMVDTATLNKEKGKKTGKEEISSHFTLRQLYGFPLNSK